MTKGKKLYDVSCYTQGGQCYATHRNCTWDDVKRYKKIASILGESVDVEQIGYVKNTN